MFKKVICYMLVFSLVLPNILAAATSTKIVASEVSTKQADDEEQDCYYEGLRQGELDYQGTGIGAGVLSGIFGLLGWGIGTVIYANQSVEVPYEYLKDLKGNCRDDYERGYKVGGKKKRNGIFHATAGAITLVVILLMIMSTSE